MKREEERSDHFQTFEDLEVYQVARQFRKAMYGVARQLPPSEKFGMFGQIRRAALSLTNNIAEGHGRFHFPDQIRFMLQARGSLEELLDDLNACLDEDYLEGPVVDPLREQAWQVHKLINGYIRYLRGRIDQRPSQRVREEPVDEILDGMNEGRSDRFNPLSLQRFNDHP